MPRKKKSADDIIMEDWAATLDAAVLTRFKVECKTSLNIMTMDMVTEWPGDLDPHSTLMIRVFIEGWLKGMENARDRMKP